MQDVDKVTVSHIFHLEFLPCVEDSGLVNHDSLETIFVNTNVYTQAKPDTCITINACQAIVSSCEIACPIVKKGEVR